MQKSKNKKRKKRLKISFHGKSSWHGRGKKRSPKEGEEEEGTIHTHTTLSITIHIYIQHLPQEVPERPKNCFVCGFHKNKANEAKPVAGSSCLVEPFSAAILVKLECVLTALYYVG